MYTALLKHGLPLAAITHLSGTPVGQRRRAPPCGVPEIDEEHEILLNLLERARAALKRVSSPLWRLPGRAAATENSGELAVILAETDAYLKDHFAHEEQLMEAWGVPAAHAEAHRQAHRAIAEAIDRLSITRAETDIAEQGRELVKILDSWLLHHMDYYDSQLGHFHDVLKGRRIFGLEELDEEHRTLDASLLDLVGAAHGNDAVRVAAAAHQLLALTRNHFMSEERQMEKRGFPGYAMHLRQHQAMYLELSSLCAGLAANVGESTCLFRSVSFIAAWYSKHVATADTAFAAWLEEQQSA